MSEDLGSDTVGLADFARWDASRTSYKISKGIVGSSLKRPRTLLERPVLVFLWFLLGAVRARLVERLSRGKDMVWTLKKKSKKHCSPCT